MENWCPQSIKGRQLLPYSGTRMEIARFLKQLHLHGPIGYHRQNGEKLQSRLNNNFFSPFPEVPGSSDVGCGNFVWQVRRQ
jgi:hypothetical protein